MDLEKGTHNLITRITQAQPRPAFFRLGIGFVGLSLVLLLAIFYPNIVNELKYRLSPPKADAEVKLTPSDPQNNGNDYIVAADPYLSIVVPKIGANARIIQDVNPLDSKSYQKALTQGVAHARGTALPGQVGNVFLFAHSSDNFINANRYNSVFYLLNKMEKGDKIYLIFNRRKFVYSVTETKIVSAEEISYMDPESETAKVTLMTCWPAGTTLRRLVVVAEIAPTE
ncbi:MAG: sortase family protein [candidate division WWE3 bacterium GW2011_GWF2_41_45]|uniref:Sortase n=3 Tax=Katanobacteria TaxID=422282 RepID=A0A1F4W1M9_UNCKA|nr:MAG: sortase family protein [candidate division WWE3 bacterium GW2011_GWC2_41_23]KKS09914.1 MAG: sortase family protein [candidate division WWE3 bacterium GW2011_GWF2_41_45]KKS19695.1 MAG: sortase family protein [candidate division WWE3 bacterium GW2011_GWE1_41_72]KKS25872.1 MAG: sortase family protein [candidate division WWE3 bacterium GW2011_GWC1_42_102]KKS29226.1 MAG: sortase family protein [candidate division WWE3 bacterium GW2011_GWD2_42_11]KKS50476.1 MAG: sortase family protein [candi